MHTVSDRQQCAGVEKRCCHLRLTADATYSSGPITQQKAALYLSRDRTAAGFTAGKGSVVGQVLMLPKLRDSYFAC